MFPALASGRLVALVAAGSLLAASAALAQRTTVLKPSIEPKRDVAQSREVVERYEVPPTKDVQELRDFIKRLESFRAVSSDEYFEHRKRSQPAIREAARRILKLEPDQTSDLYRDAERAFFDAVARTIGDDRPQAQQELLDGFLEYLHKQQKDLGRVQANQAYLFGEALEKSGNQKLAAAANAAFADLFGPSRAPYQRHFAGAARRLRLPGKRLEIEAPLIWNDGPADGQGLFSINHLKGHFCFVVFTRRMAAEPFQREWYALRKIHREHAKADLALVVVAADPSRDQLLETLHESRFPGRVIHDPGAELFEWYGITGFYSGILIDPDGIVVAANVGNEELSARLSAHFKN